MTKNIDWKSADIPTPATEPVGTNDTFGNTNVASRWRIITLLRELFGRKPPLAPKQIDKLMTDFELPAPDTRQSVHFLTFSTGKQTVVYGNHEEEYALSDEDKHLMSQLLKGLALAQKLSAPRAAGRGLHRMRAKTGVDTEAQIANNCQDAITYFYRSLDDDLRLGQSLATAVLRGLRQVRTWSESHKKPLSADPPEE